MGVNDTKYKKTITVIRRPDRSPSILLITQVNSLHVMNKAVITVSLNVIFPVNQDDGQATAMSVKHVSVGESGAIGD